MVVENQSKAKVAETAKITSQFRERAGMVYELDCLGTSLLVKMMPEDPREAAWRLEVSVRGSADIERAAATTRGAALELIEQHVRAEQGVLAVLDWTAIRRALATVSAI